MRFYWIWILIIFLEFFKNFHSSYFFQHTLQCKYKEIHIRKNSVFGHFSRSGSYSTFGVFFLSCTRVFFILWGVSSKSINLLSYQKNNKTNLTMFCWKPVISNATTLNRSTALFTFMCRNVRMNKFTILRFFEQFEFTSRILNYFSETNSEWKFIHVIVLKFFLRNNNHYQNKSKQHGICNFK